MARGVLTTALLLLSLVLLQLLSSGSRNYFVVSGWTTTAAAAATRTRRHFPTPDPLSEDVATFGSTLRLSASSSSSSASVSPTESDSSTTYRPLFDFARNGTVDAIERLDDVVMGGISTSTVVAAAAATTTDGQPPYARWFGVCRTDGGGFCGFRTDPFEEPVRVGNDVDGLYVVCRLASDDDADRRVWKMSTRTKPDRGEVLYQAPVEWQQQRRQRPSAGGDEADWSVAKVPFDTFRLVRGPRIVPDGPPLNVTGGLYQIGMTMSKFVFGENTTELENFRPGFFELHMKEIGVYKDTSSVDETALSSSSSSLALAPVEPKVLSKEEAEKRRPLIQKLLLPVIRLLFNEKIQRRKSAMRILRRRGLTRGRAILFGLRSRAPPASGKAGLVRSAGKTAAILISDSARFAVFLALRLAIVYPVKLATKTIRFLQNVFKAKSLD